ncbi:MAG: NAD(P)/FAD-dependent oxidoreductase [Bacteroidota bacterium]
MKKEYDVIVIGAGASGLLAAGSAAQAGADVLVLEKKERAGRKVLITGKGRCNLTNTATATEYFGKIHPNGRFLKHAFSTFFSADIIRIMNEHGTETVTERGGRVFPSSSSSADVVKALLDWLRPMPAEIRYNTRVSRIVVRDGYVEGVESKQGSETQFYHAKKVILCAGGSSYPATGSDGDGIRLAEACGHTVKTVHPALVPLESKHPAIPHLQGLSLKNVKAALWIGNRKKYEEFGEMLFTHFGLSGPIILTLSRYAVEALNAGSPVHLTLDLKPALTEQQLDARLLRDLDQNGKKHLANLLRLWLPSTMADWFLTATALDPSLEGHQLGSRDRRKILLLMKEMRFEIDGYRPFREAIITAGGVSCEEIDPRTMASRKAEGLYLAGEVLDLDADTGGYNLQIAWSTGWLAGQSAGSVLQESR